ncbi:hypothetical protein DFH06DRAFT_1123782 [Mycena polygramma]|nr:hypothetical protein DFH06DRAFT_1123782 [Mycena polygramma]
MARGPRVPRLPSCLRALCATTHRSATARTWRGPFSWICGGDIRGPMARHELTRGRPIHSSVHHMPALDNERRIRARICRRSSARRASPNGKPPVGSKTFIETAWGRAVMQRENGGMGRKGTPAVAVRSGQAPATWRQGRRENGRPETGTRMRHDQSSGSGSHFHFHYSGPVEVEASLSGSGTSTSTVTHPARRALNVGPQTMACMGLQTGFQLNIGIVNWEVFIRGNVQRGCRSARTVNDSSLDNLTVFVDKTRTAQTSSFRSVPRMKNSGADGCFGAEACVGLEHPIIGEEFKQKVFFDVPPN